MTSEWRPGPRYGVTDTLGDGVRFDEDTYVRLLQRLLDADYEFVGFDGEIGFREVALRHDVDLSVERAVEMAKLESSLGVTSTYCFLVTAPVYDLLTPANRRRLRCIEDAGHDVGLHFDPHHYWDSQPVIEDLEARVAADRAILERIVDGDVEAVSIHRPPEWALDTEFGRFESTYGPSYFSEVGYVSDSNQKWRDGDPFADGVPDSLQLLVHPGLWHPTDRPMIDIVDDVRDRRFEQVEDYLRDIGN